MGEPLTRAEAGEAALAESASRLDRALAMLESRLGRAPRPAATSPAATSEVIVLGLELEVAHRRSRDLESAAAAASDALGRAVIEVTRALDDESRDDDPREDDFGDDDPGDDDSGEELPPGPGLLDLPPESVQDTITYDEDEADETTPPPEKDPT